LGDFASSDTLATYGAVYFTNPDGINPSVVIPGVFSPRDTVMRVARETLRSGEDFSRLQWTAIASFSETDYGTGLFSDKLGMVTLQYAITREFSLLGTGGYDAISSSNSPLYRDL